MESHEYDSIAGQRIVAVREMTDEELEREGWHAYHGTSPAVLEL